ncbi:MAG: D-alanyl-D-alanine carboxypeptidase family protein [Clostridia bacterium]
MSVKRFFRVLFGLILLAGFVYCLYCNYQVAPKLLEPENWLPTIEVEVPPSETSAPQPPELTPVDVTPAPEATPEPAAEPTPEPVDPESPEGRAAAMGLPAPPEIDIESWEFILANEYNSIGEYVPQGPEMLEGQPLDSRIIEAMRAFVADARDHGVSVYLSSGYRSYADQRYLYNRKVAQYPPDGKDSNGRWIVLPPGTSEHQTGLACDITDVYHEFKDRTLADTDTFQYMSKHCQDFGFVVRYPEDKEEVTGVMYEPWHYRYVGVEAATYMMENGICLEEFVSLYRDIYTADHPAPEE